MWHAVTQGIVFLLRNNGFSLIYANCYVNYRHSCRRIKKSTLFHRKWNVLIAEQETLSMHGSCAAGWASGLSWITSESQFDDECKENGRRNTTTRPSPSQSGRISALPPPPLLMRARNESMLYGASVTQLVMQPSVKCSPAILRTRQTRRTHYTRLLCPTGTVQTTSNHAAVDCHQ